MWGQVFEETLELEDGFVRPPDRPGLGVEINREAIQEYRIA